jgi:outer membrane lipoprotein-sorting protein
MATPALSRTVLSRTASSRRLRLLAPVLAVGVVAVGVTVPRLADASDDALPPVTAAELLAAVSEAEVDGLSGTVVATSRLGLPELPREHGHSGRAVTLPDLLAGSTTARVWKAGGDRSRVAVDAPFAEYDVVRDGRDVWTFDSASSDVTHLVLPEPAPDAATEPSAPPAGIATPEDVADALLASVEPTTAVSVGRAEQVAGRPAYELVLRPRDEGTLVDSVRVAVDAETSVPLRVRVFGDQVEPAFEVAFTDVRFAVPDDAVFAFVPPAGSTVEEKSLEGGHAPTVPEGAPAPDGQVPAERPQVLGSGWTSVVELSGVELPERAGLVNQLARPVPRGRVIESALLSVLLLDDGRVLAGPVPYERLVQLAGR